jgi:EAL domain-containing protein (putative c-di-GMP-specific phosphodiesterase class I)/AmiR/NasT family two-component response regulator
MATTGAIAPFRALILEDHEFQRRMAVQVLKDCGASEVQEAAEGGAALRVIQQQDPPFDVLICDLSMPGMDGLAFLRHLAEHGSRSAVILASALDSSIIRSAVIMAQEYGLQIIGMVEKPLSREKVLPLVLRHLSKTYAAPRRPIEVMALGEIASGLDGRQFEPYFQPKVDILTGELVGVEALMRWSHPDRGLILPRAFIRLMEANGLLSHATYTLVEMSLAHGRRWQESGLIVPIAINVSADLLSNTRLPDRLESMTRAAGLSPGSVTIEVTESVAMSDIGHSLETLTRCRMKGFALSIDDYGTGFSSMRHLTRLPLSELKIDQSFVTEAAKSPVLCAMIETSVTLAKRLNLKTVAEGVESKEDWDVVARLGCSVAQGFLIAEPMPAEELARWYDGWLNKQCGGLLPARARSSPNVPPVDITAE